MRATSMMSMPMPRIMLVRSFGSQVSSLKSQVSGPRSTECGMRSAWDGTTDHGTEERVKGWDAATRRKGREKFEKIFLRSGLLRIGRDWLGLLGITRDGGIGRQGKVVKLSSFQGFRVSVNPRARLTFWTRANSIAAGGCCSRGMDP